MVRARKVPPPSPQQADKDAAQAERAKAEQQLVALGQQEQSLSASAADSERMATLYRAALKRCRERQADLRKKLEA